MKHFLFLIGILIISRQAHGVYEEELLKAKHHDTHDICSTVPNWALIAHPDDCHKFYVCANRVPEEFNCAHKYFFDKKQNRCILGSCSKIKECQNGLQRVAQDCHAFETCEDGNYVREYCPKDSFFNEALGICMPISNTPQHKCSCILPPYTVFKNPADCKTFYACINGEAVLQQCQKGQYFNAYLNTCVIDTRGVCLTTISTISPEEKAMLEICQRIGLSDNDVTNTGSLFFNTDTDDCSKFYICINGRVAKKYCPQGFFYNRQQRFCEADTNGIVCKTIREHAKKKQQEEEKQKETQNHKHEFIYEQEKEHKPTIKLSLSMTHDGIKHVELEPHTVLPINAENFVQTQPLIVSVPEIIVQNSETKNIEEDKEEKVLDKEELNNNSAEVEEPNSVEMKLPLYELKLPMHSHYDKLASKFMAF